MFDVIKTAYALKNGVSQRSVYNWHAPVFLFTNENIPGYLSQINDVADKNILTVTGSGDHAFECLVRGAKRVDTFDVNYLQRHVLELKSKMIKHLPYLSFMHFFFNEADFFNRDIIKPIWHKFTPALKIFLNKYYKMRDRSLFRYRTAQSIFYDIDKISYINDVTAYSYLSHIMPDKIGFTHTDLMNIANRCNTVYDTILLSNISEYMFEEIPDTAGRIMAFYDNVITPIADRNLNANNGQICFNYAWCANTADYRTMIDAIQQYMKYRIDDFCPLEHKIDMVTVPTTYNSVMNPGAGMDVALTFSQKTR